MEDATPAYPEQRHADSLLRDRLVQRLFAGGLLVAAAVSGAVLWQYRREQAVHDEVLRTQRTLAALEAVLVHALNLQTGARGYLLTGDELFLSPFNLGRSSIGRALDDVAALSGPAAADRTADLRSQVGDLQRLIEERVDLRRRTDLGTALQQLPLTDSKRQMDSLRFVIAGWERELQTDLETTLDNLRRHQRFTSLTLTLGVGTTLGALSALVLVQRRRARQSQRARDATEAVLNEAQAIARLGSWELDVATGRGVWSNEMFALTGFAPAAGVPPVGEFLARVHADDRAALMANHAAAAERSQGFRQEFRLLRPGGEERWFETRVRATGPAGGPAARLEGTMLDVTDRRAAEAAVAESETRLRLALDAARTGVFDWDMATGRIVWSRWHEEMWGFAPGEFPGTFEAFARRVHPEDLAGIDAEVQRCIAARTTFEREFRIVRPDGSQRWIAGRGEFEFDPTGRAVRMRGAVIDITPRRRAEELLALESDRSRTLARRLLSAQEDERRRLAHELHDELGQTLTALKLALQSAQRGHPAPSQLAMAIELAAAGLSQTRDLSLRLRPPLLDDLGLAPALRWLVDRTRGGPTPVRLTIDGEEERFPTAIATAAFRITQESLTNALRHAHASGVAIDVRRADDALVVTISDDGAGFDYPATRAQVARDGTSLGLLGLEERAELAGGSVVVDSTPGRGTRVTARFPLGPAPS